MIHNYDLARAINKDRYCDACHRRQVAKVQTNDIRRTVGRWLESLGKRLQSPRPSSV